MVLVLFNLIPLVVKEHFSEKGKTMEELLTDVMLEKAKQTIA